MGNAECLTDSKQISKFKDERHVWNEAYVMRLSGLSRTASDAASEFSNVSRKKDAMKDRKEPTMMSGQFDLRRRSTLYASLRAAHKTMGLIGEESPEKGTAEMAPIPIIRQEVNGKLQTITIERNKSGGAYMISRHSTKNTVYF